MHTWKDRAETRLESSTAKYRLRGEAIKLQEKTIQVLKEEVHKLDELGLELKNTIELQKKELKLCDEKLVDFEQRVKASELSATDKKSSEISTQTARSTPDEINEEIRLKNIEVKSLTTRLSNSEGKIYLLNQKLDEAYKREKKYEAELFRRPSSTKKVKLDANLTRTRKSSARHPATMKSFLDR